MRPGHWLYIIPLKLRSLLRRQQVEQELDEEISYHIEQEIEQGIARGLTPEEARRVALRAMDGITQRKEECRDMRGLNFIETLWQDVRHAARMLRRSPAFAAVAILSLALAIGANSAIFSVINGVILRSLPYRDSGRLAMLWTSMPKEQEDEAVTSVPNFVDWKTQSQTFEDMAFYATEGATLIDRTETVEPETIDYAAVSANFISVLGVSPALGRGFSEQEAIQGDRVVVLSDELWRRRFGASPQVLGQVLDLDGAVYQVIGVMPKSFRFPARQIQLWAPATASRWWKQFDAHRDRGAVVVCGRLKSGYGFAQAQAEMNAIARRLELQYPEANAGSLARVVPLQAQVLGRTIPFILLVLFGAVGLVLLIACANVANLVLARASAREREMAVRTALGASQSRLVRQMLTESTLLALCAGCLGLPLAAWGIHLLAVLGPQNIPRLDEVNVDFRVLAFMVTLSGLSGITFGLAPAVKISQRDPNESLTLNSRKLSTSRNRTMGSALVIAEFSFAVVLLTGTGLLIRSFLAVEAVDPGLQPQRVVTLQLNLRHNDDFYEQMMERIRAIPGVQAAGTINEIFFAHGEKSMGVDSLQEVEGRPAEPRDRWTPLVITPNSGDIFRALGMRLLKGRLLTVHDGEPDPLVVIVNETMARRFWPGEDPIGRRFKGYPGRSHDWVTVVGLVQDVRNLGLEKQPVAQMFAAPKQFKPGAILVIRADNETGPLVSAVRSVIHSMDKRAVVGKVATLAQQLDAQTSQRRFQSYLLGLFSVIALVLAGIGIYGVMHYSVVRRTHEIGIRMALGARAEDVLRMVIRQGLTLALAGTTLGLSVAWGLTRVISSLLFGVSPTDPLTFLTVAVLLNAIALIASYIPARRATKVDPVVALRCE